MGSTILALSGANLCLHGGAHLVELLEKSSSSSLMILSIVQTELSPQDEARVVAALGNQGGA